MKMLTSKVWSDIGKDESGATSISYALITSGIGGMIAAPFSYIGVDVEMRNIVVGSAISATALVFTYNAIDLGMYIATLYAEMGN